MMRLKTLQRITLYIYFFSLNFEVFNLLGLGSTAFITGVVYFISVIPEITSFLNISQIKKFFQPIIIFWILLTIISIIHINPYSSSFFDSSLLLNIILFLIIINHERKDSGVLLKAIFSFALGTAVLTLLYNLGIGIEIDGGRISIFGDNENIIGIRLSISIIVFFYIILEDPFSFGFWRFLLFIPIPDMLMFMFATGSRLAFISFALEFVVGVIFYQTKKRWYKVILLILAIGASAYFFQLMKQSEILINRLLLTRETGDLAGRDIIWLELMPLIKANFIWGVGETGYKAFTYRIFGGNQSPHNVILEVLSYTGIIGLVLYLNFIAKATIQSWKTFKINNYLLPFLLMIPVFGDIVSGQALNAKIVWAILAFAVSAVFYSNGKME